MTGADAMVKALSGENVDVVFGIPGVQIMGLLDAFHQNRSVKWITTRHEQAAAFMAFGYARTTGKPGVAMVVPGPGALNSTAAIGTAFAASTPVLLLAGQIDTPNLGKDRGVLHDFSRQLEVFRPITKWNNRIAEVRDIPGTVREAIKRSREGRPRPVQLEIPFDLWADKDKVSFDTPPAPAVIEPDPSGIQQAASILATASRPVIWAGGGVVTANASNELERLAERLSAPVVMTTEGKGALSSAHPLCAGTADYDASRVLSFADAILCIGTRLLNVEGVLSRVSVRPKIIHLDVDPEEVGRDIEIDLGIVSDARLGLTALLAELPGSIGSAWEPTKIEESNRSFLSKMEHHAPVQTSIMRDIRSELDDDAILVPDITGMGYWSRYVYPVYKPRTYLTTSYFVTLGFAFPTALGVKVGKPDKQVVAISGDGGFLFTAGDLATAVQQRLNVVTIIFNDGVYGATYKIQQQSYDNRIIGTDLHNPNFAAFAESFGAVGVKLSNHRELRSALRSALKESGPVVIEVPTECLPHPWEIFRKSQYQPDARQR